MHKVMQDRQTNNNKKYEKLKIKKISRIKGRNRNRKEDAIFVPTNNFI